MRTLATLGLIAVLALTGCSSGDSADGPGDRTSPGPTASATQEDAPTVDITIKDGKVTPQGDRVDVKVGQKVTLRITSDAEEEVHVHSEPEHEYEIAPGDDKTYSFTLAVPGQVAIEAHHLDVTIAQLVVRP